MLGIGAKFPMLGICVGKGVGVGIGVGVLVGVRGIVGVFMTLAELGSNSGGVGSAFVQDSKASSMKIRRQ